MNLPEAFCERGKARCRETTIGSRPGRQPGRAARESSMTTDYRFGNVELRPAQRVLLVGGKESRIGSRAFDLLLALVERRDRVVAKDELLDSVWSGMVV